MTSPTVRSWVSPRLHAPRATTWLIATLIFTACSPESDAASGSTDGPRVVALVPSLAEIVVAVGGAEHLVARTDFDTHPETLGLPSIGGGLDPNLESMVELGVDAVFMTSERDSSATSARFEDLGVEVHGFPTQTVEDVHRSIERIGAVLGREAAADSLSGAIRDDLAAIRDRVAGRDLVPVMYIVWHDPPMTAGGGTFIDQIVEVAGGRNVFADALMEWPSVGFESIVARDPHVIVWPRGEFDPDRMDALQALPGWRDVPAVRAGRVVFVDGNLFNRPGPGVAEAARVLAEALHPEAF